MARASKAILVGGAILLLALAAGSQIDVIDVDDLRPFPPPDPRPDDVPVDDVIVVPDLEPIDEDQEVIVVPDLEPIHEIPSDVLDALENTERVMLGGGHWYQIRSGDNPIYLARAALGVGPGHSATMPYVGAMARSQWNTALYGTERPARTGGTLIDYAFRPTNANALQTLRDGFLPTRSIDALGRAIPGKVTSRYGLVWIPEVATLRDAPASVWDMPAGERVS